MTYRELFYKATRLINNGEITLGEYEEMTKPLDRDIEQEPKTGHWIEEINNYGKITHWHCSNCYDDSGFITTCKWDYCPNCGANMEGEK